MEEEEERGEREQFQQNRHGLDEVKDALEKAVECTDCTVDEVRHSI